MSDISAPLRLLLDRDALLSNWRWLAAQSGDAACGAAIKANGYGLGARAVMDNLLQAGCRDFFVANWAEAMALGPVPDGVSLSVLHGVREADMPVALSGIARPVLISPEQVARWKAAGGGLCDLMVDTGMNRLGLDWGSDFGSLVQGLHVDTLLSHLACADEDNSANQRQFKRFSGICGLANERRRSLANSAGICLGREYAFDLTRPGLALYGGLPRAEAQGHIRQVVTPQAQILQRRRILAGEGVGYNALVTVERDTEAAILNIGYADGYLRGFSCRGSVFAGERKLPVLGRVSMDLLIIDVSAAPEVGEGDWLSIAYDLPDAAAVSGLSQYELLTGLGTRFDRIWR